MRKDHLLRRTVIEGGSDLDSGARMDLSLDIWAELDAHLKLRIMSLQ